jgi:multisubunit Na+/H+ antiporter MnhB subunit
MGFIISLLTPAINFVRTNFSQILAALIIGLVTTLAFYITVNSLRKMKSEIFSYYPFDRFFPASGKWSLIYFFITVIFLGGLIFFFAKGGFYLSPA